MDKFNILKFLIVYKIKNIYNININGYVVVENIFNEYEVEKIRNKLHKTIEKMNINHNNILIGTEQPPNEIRNKSDVANIFYSEWKLDICLNEKIYNIYKLLMDATFGPGNIDGFEHPLGESNNILPYIDRICYRFPDYIRAEGGLGLHIDRNPINPYKQKKFRPIQSFISLVDHYDNESGGLQLVPKFHKEYDKYFHKNIDNENIFGEFHRLNNVVHKKLYNKLETIIAPRGSVVFWDNRLPHKTCDKLTSFDTREVIYFSYLPSVQINKLYCEQQYNNIQKNIYPPSYHDSKNYQIADRDWSLDKLENNYVLLKNFTD